MDLRELYRRFRAWQQNPFDYTNHSEHLVRCANCGTEFSDNFCPRCGQKAGVGPVNWQTVRQGLMMIWGMDSRSLSYSLLQLLLRPGYLISDYISGKRQVSFPPVKMLLIVAVGAMIIDYLCGKPLDNMEIDNGVKDVALDAFEDWSETNPGWGMLAACSLLIFPTWLYFRYAPKHRQHTLPEGFFVQVFMSSLVCLLSVVGVIIRNYWGLLPLPIYYFITYHQLFGYGWWGTLWRTILCFFQGLFLLSLIGKLVNIIVGVGVPHQEWGALYVLFFSIIFFALIGYGFEWRNKKRNVPNGPEMVE